VGAGSCASEPAPDYDTSLKFFRKVYKDCLICFAGNRYYVPAHVVGKKVLLKVKNDVVCVYHDADRLSDSGIQRAIGIPLRPSRTSQQTPRYGRKATRGLVTGTLYPEVYHRPLSEYDRYANGGASWSN
jgi:hypothetical protein